MEFKVNNLEEMCDLMCDNVIPKQDERKYLKECIDCNKLINGCKGMPLEVDTCINFDRKAGEGFG